MLSAMQDAPTYFDSIVQIIVGGRHGQRHVLAARNTPNHVDAAVDNLDSVRGAVQKETIRRPRYKRRKPGSKFLYRVGKWLINISRGQPPIKQLLLPNVKPNKLRQPHISSPSTNGGGLLLLEHDNANPATKSKPSKRHASDDEHSAEEGDLEDRTSERSPSPGGSENSTDDSSEDEGSHTCPEDDVQWDDEEVTCTEAVPNVIEATGSSRGFQFWAHAGLLCSRSLFFKRILNDRWKDSDDNIVELPDDDPEIFKTYLAMLYSGRLYVSGDSFYLLCRLYVLAEKLQDTKSRNDIMDALYQEAENKDTSFSLKTQDLLVINYVYENTPESCPLRKVLTKMWINNGQDLKDLEPAGLSNISKDFLFDLTNGMMEWRKGTFRGDWHASQYYCSEPNPRKRKHDGPQTATKRARTAAE